MGAALALVAADWDEAEEDDYDHYRRIVSSVMSSAREDSMGLGTVVYFPGLQLEGEGE